LYPVLGPSGATRSPARTAVGSPSGDAGRGPVVVVLAGAGACGPLVAVVAVVGAAAAFPPAAT
jgi:hypothetical protein